MPGVKKPLVSNSVLTVLFVLTVAATTYHTLAAFWYPARLAYIMSTGGSHLCSWNDAMESHRQETARQDEAQGLAIRSRLVRAEAGMNLWETPDGLLWIPEANPYTKGGFRTVRWRKVEGIADPPVREGDVVIDCGGHWGNSALVAFSMGASIVITFEPEPTNVECIRRNLKPFIEAGRAIVFDNGVWDKEMSLFFRQHGNSAAGHIEAEEGTPVEVTTIDKVVSDLKLQRVDFIKMDIEGSEQKALQGAQETIRRFKPRLSISSYNLSADPKEIPRFVKQVRSDYTLRCSRCLPTHGMIIPNLYYFY